MMILTGSRYRYQKSAATRAGRPAAAAGYEGSPENTRSHVARFKREFWKTAVKANK